MSEFRPKNSSGGIKQRFVGGPLDGLSTRARLGPPERVWAKDVTYVRLYKESDGCHVYVVESDPDAAGEQE